MTLHAFLILWAWFAHQQCIVRTNYGLGPIVYGGGCPEAVSVARQVTGAWFYWPVNAVVTG